MITNTTNMFLRCRDARYLFVIVLLTEPRDLNIQIVRSSSNMMDKSIKKAIYYLVTNTNYICKLCRTVFKRYSIFFFPSIC